MWHARHQNSLLIFIFAGLLFCDLQNFWLCKQVHVPPVGLCLFNWKRGLIKSLETVGVINLAKKNATCPAKIALFVFWTFKSTILHEEMSSSSFMLPAIIHIHSVYNMLSKKSLLQPSVKLACLCSTDLLDEVIYRHISRMTLNTETSVIHPKGAGDESSVRLLTTDFKVTTTYCCPVVAVIHKY